MDNKIFLSFEKSLSGLAGFDFGMETYQKQVYGKVDFNKKITLVFPDNIKRIASSFIQGFFEDFIRHIGLSGIEENLEIQSAKPDMKETIITNLL